MKTEKLTFEQKVVKIIKTMQSGALISGTNGVYRCDDIHISKKEVRSLASMGLIKRKRLVGEYSVELELTDDGKQCLQPIVSINRP